MNLFDIISWHRLHNTIRKKIGRKRKDSLMFSLVLILELKTWKENQWRIFPIFSIIELLNISRDISYFVRLSCVYLPGECIWLVKNEIVEVFNPKVFPSKLISISLSLGLDRKFILKVY